MPDTTGATAWLGIGSNRDPEHHVRIAVAALRDAFDDVVLSPVYRSAAVGFEGRDFLNLVARVRTSLEPLALKAWLNELESRHGRDRDMPKFSDRTLDVDILLYGDQIMTTPELTLPRGEIVRFAHVLQPLADLDPALRHPTDGRTMAELLAAMPPVDPPLVRVELDLG